MTRVLIADDHAIVRAGLRAILQAQPDFEVIGDAANGQEAVEKAIAEKPNVVVIDYEMPVRNGLDAAQEIKARLPRTEILIFTLYDDEDTIEAILRAGARGYVLKSEANDHLVAAVRALARHQAYFSDHLSTNLLDTLLSRRTCGEPKEILTLRERTVVQLIAEGHSNKGIAQKLDLSIKTVETHRTTAMRKLGARSTADLVRFAIRSRMVRA